MDDAEATPLLLVVQQRSECSMELVEPLLQHGADPNWQMHYGYTALDILAQRWGKRPESEHDDAIGILRQHGGKTASKLHR